MTQKKATYFSALVLFFLILFHYLGWLRSPENLLRNALSRTSGFFYDFKTALDNFSERRLSYRRLFETNRDCVGKLRSLTINQAEFKRLKEENELLRLQLNFAKTKKNYLSAEVVGRAANAAGNIIIIDRGEADGLKPNKPAVAGEGFLVGKVVRLEKSIAYVRLLTDNQSKIAVTVLNKNRTMGVVSGEHGLSLKLGMVPQNEIISAGDEVVTSGLELNMPRGLLVGRVGPIAKETYEPFQSAIVEPFIDMNKLTVVTILLD